MKLVALPLLLGFACSFKLESQNFGLRTATNWVPGHKDCRTTENRPTAENPCSHTVLRERLEASGATVPESRVFNVCWAWQAGQCACFDSNVEEEDGTHQTSLGTPARAEHFDGKILCTEEMKGVWYGLVQGDDGEPVAGQYDTVGAVHEESAQDETPQMQTWEASHGSAQCAFETYVSADATPLCTACPTDPLYVCGMNSQGSCYMPIRLSDGSYECQCTSLGNDNDLALSKYECESAKCLGLWCPANPQLIADATEAQSAQGVYRMEIDTNLTGKVCSTRLYTFHKHISSTSDTDISCEDCNDACFAHDGCVGYSHGLDSLGNGYCIGCSSSDNMINATYAQAKFFKRVAADSSEESQSEMMACEEFNRFIQADGMVVNADDNEDSQLSGDAISPPPEADSLPDDTASDSSGSSPSPAPSPVPVPVSAPTPVPSSAATPSAATSNQMSSSVTMSS